jgi:acetyltransferase-like isoleucine patch superfamily enzyme
MEKSCARGAFNRILHIAARFGPGATSLRPWIHRLRGIKITGNVFIGDEVYIENEHPEAVEIHDGAQIALRTTIVAHLRGSGKIVIGKNAWIGACCTVAAGYGQTLIIGEGAVVAAGSVITKDVSPFTFVAGVPAKPKMRVTVPMTLQTTLENFKAGLKPLE